MVATEVRGPDGTIPCPGAAVLAGALRRRRLRVRLGPIVSSPKMVRGAERERLHATGAIAVDMESAWLAAGAGGRPLAVVRAVVDTPARELTRPLALVNGAGRAYWALRQAAGVLSDWAAAVRPHRVVLAAPRASCAGVERAIEVVERALESFGPPVYVRRQIVHNAHVVADLESRGAIFVDEVDEVPDGARLIFSAHGVSPAVREDAAAARLRRDRRHLPAGEQGARRGAPLRARGLHDRPRGPRGARRGGGDRGRGARPHPHPQGRRRGGELEVEDPDRVAYLTQTTLAVEETDRVVDALRERFPTLTGPASSDICYATQNRQDAVKQLAADCDLVLVVGSGNSSNSRRLVEVAERHGVEARLIEDESEIEPAWLARARTIGLTAGASAPEAIVQRVLAALCAQGPAEVVERRAATETVQFRLPPEVRRGGN